MRSQSIPGAPPVYPMDASASLKKANREHARSALNQFMSQYGMSKTTMNVTMPGASGGGAPTGSPTNPMLFALFGSAAKSPTTFGTSQTGRLPGLLNNNPF